MIEYLIKPELKKNEYIGPKTIEIDSNNSPSYDEQINNLTLAYQVGIGEFFELNPTFFDQSKVYMGRGGNGTGCDNPSGGKGNGGGKNTRPKPNQGSGNGQGQGQNGGRGGRNQK